MKKRTKSTKRSIRFHSKMHAVFADPFALTRNDISDSEGRHQIIGHINGVLMILAVYTVRKNDQEEIIRIISARKATLAERRQYEKGNWF